MNFFTCTSLLFSGRRTRKVFGFADSFRVLIQISSLLLMDFRIMCRISCLFIPNRFDKELREGSSPSRVIVYSPLARSSIRNFSQFLAFTRHCGSDQTTFFLRGFTRFTGFFFKMNFFIETL